jgi:hypothetical protein
MRAATEGECNYAMSKRGNRPAALRGRALALCSQMRTAVIGQAHAGNQRCMARPLLRRTVTASAAYPRQWSNSLVGVNL